MPLTAPLNAGVGRLSDVIESQGYENGVEEISFCRGEAEAL